MEFLFTFSKINFSNEAILSCSSNFQILSPLSEKRKRSCNISFSRFCTASPCIYTYILYTVSNVVARERDREKLKILERGGSKKRETLYGGSNNYVCTCMCVCVHGWVTRVGRSVTDQPWNPGLGSPLSGLIIRGSTRESFEKFLPANFPSPPSPSSKLWDRPCTEIIKYDAKLLPFFAKSRATTFSEIETRAFFVKSPFKTILYFFFFFHRA